jgi:hypothetical protein
VIAQNDTPDVHVYGVGGRVVGSPRAFIEGLVPDVENGRAGIQVGLDITVLGANAQFAAAVDGADGDDDGSGTAYGVRGGAFH